MGIVRIICRAMYNVILEIFKDLVCVSDYLDIFIVGDGWRKKYINCKVGLNKTSVLYKKNKT